MKKTTLFIVTFLFVTIGYAQSSYQDEVQLMQSLYGMQKKELVAQFVELNDSQSTEFWALYDEYEVKRKEIGKKKFELIFNYVNDYGQIKAEDANMFMKEAIPLRKKSDELVDHYYNKLKNKIDPVVAVQFYQIENYLSDIVRLELLGELYITKEK